MPTLAQISNKIRDRAVALAPKRTGNLKKQLATFNRPSGMIKEIKTKTTRSFEFNLDVSPPNAEYGKWWNDPTVSKTVRNQKTGHRDSINFAQQAMNDPEVLKMIDDYLAEIADGVVDQLTTEIKKLDSK